MRCARIRFVFLISLSYRHAPERQSFLVSDSFNAHGLFISQCTYIQLFYYPEYRQARRT